MHNTFARRHALARIAGAFCQGIGIAELGQAVDLYLADASIRRLDAGVEREARFTTEGLLACEIAIVDGAQRRRDESTAVLAPELVDEVIAAHRRPCRGGRRASHGLGRGPIR